MQVRYDCRTVLYVSMINMGCKGATMLGKCLANVLVQTFRKYVSHILADI